MHKSVRRSCVLVPQDAHCAQAAEESRHTFVTCKGLASGGATQSYQPAVAGASSMRQKAAAKSQTPRLAIARAA
eukprot:363499-Chlamydomonas_euryale.AAC.8